MRQIPDEAHGVRQYDFTVIREFQSPHRRIERREQLVLDKHASVRQRIEQGRLARIRVPDEGDGRDPGSQPVLPIHRAAAIDVLESLIKLANPFPDQATVGFELGFTRAAEPNTALLSLEVSPASDQACREVPQLGELNLQLALETAGPLRKNIQDQPGSVEHTTVERLLQVSFLAGTQWCTRNDELCMVFIDTSLQVGQLPFADEKVLWSDPKIYKNLNKNIYHSSEYLLANNFDSLAVGP